MIKLIEDDVIVRKRRSRGYSDYIKFNRPEIKNDRLVTLNGTKERRKNQICRSYEIKIDKSHLNNDTSHQLNMIFLEGKWFQNYVISQNNIYDVDYKMDKVPIKVKDNFETRKIKYLSSQMKQEIVNRIIDNINGLSSTKKKGKKVGKLKYKSKMNSVPLIQYGVTYKILDNKYIKIQGIKQKIRVNGLEQILDQIEDGIEVANANLIRKHGDFYIHIVTYIDKKQEKKDIKEIRHIGLDFGVANQIVSSNGIRIKYRIPINEKIRKLYQKMSRQKLYSKNWHKTRNKLRKEFDKLNNIKGDIKNKIIHRFQEKYPIVCYQDDNVKSWQRIWGSRILETSIGGTISMLETKIHTPVEIDRFFPSTKRCSKCGNIREIILDERTYICDDKKCGNIMDRDWNSSINIDDEGLKILDIKIGTVRTKSTPEEILTSTIDDMEYFNKIPYVEASLVCDPGSSLRGLGSSSLQYRNDQKCI